MLNNILDLVLVNDPRIVNKLTVTWPLGNSDHNKVEFELIAAIPREADDSAIISTVKYDFTKANWTVLREILNATDWNSIFSGSVPVDDTRCLFENNLWQAIESTVPTKPVRCNMFLKPMKKNYPRFINKLLNKKTSMAAPQAHKQWAK